MFTTLTDESPEKDIGKQREKDDGGNKGVETDSDDDDAFLTDLLFQPS